MRDTSTLGTTALGEVPRYYLPRARFVVARVELLAAVGDVDALRVLPRVRAHAAWGRWFARWAEHARSESHAVIARDHLAAVVDESPARVRSSLARRE